MLLAFLVLALFVFGLTRVGMARLRRGFILSLVAGLTRQEVPIEGALREICARHSHSVLGLSRLKSLVRRLEKGASLAEGLEALRLIAARDACVLDHAQEHGVAARVLDRMATQAVRVERRELRTAALLAYPVLIGLVLFGVTQFAGTFILPKLEQMFREMENASLVSLPNLELSQTVVMVALVLLFLWAGFMFVVHVSRGAPVAWIPFIGTHVQLREQAQLARHFAVVLESGSTLEEAVGVLDRGGGGGCFKRRIERIANDLQSGVPPADAFRLNGRWRPEFQWALDAISKGAEPGTTFDTVAQVLEGKAEERLNAISRFGAPVAVLLAGCAVGWFTSIIFQMLNALALQML